MPDLARLAAVARGLLPPGTAVAVADPGRLYPLLPGEVLPGAVPARLAEFSAGRHAARIAMDELGLPRTALPMADDRAPVWPDGVAGSISHGAGACLAAVSRGATGLGLDLEDDSPLDGGLWDIVLLPAERVWVMGQADPGLAAKTVFSAKEAAYKAQYPVSRSLFGFDRLAVQMDGPAFTARFTTATPPFAAGGLLHGGLARIDSVILTVVTL